MLRGFYTAGTGMLVQRDRMDVLTGNLTNADTTGFKSDFLILSTFQDMMIQRFGSPYYPGPIGTLGSGAHIDRVYTSFEQGNIEQTGRYCDFALEGDGFFAVSTPAGTRYTRDGSFSVSETGYLVNSEGYYVQGAGGNIYVGSDSFTVDEQGNIYVADTLSDRLSVVSFADMDALRKDGNNLFQTGQAALQSDAKVIQGSLEGSNVDISSQLADMMSISRAYETNQRVLRMMDGTLDKAVNDVGRV